MFDFGWICVFLGSSCIKVLVEIDLLLLDLLIIVRVFLGWMLKLMFFIVLIILLLVVKFMFKLWICKSGLGDIVFFYLIYYDLIYYGRCGG